MFSERSTERERIDTGDYTPEEYSVFLREIAFINKYLGDQRALKKSLLKDIRGEWQKSPRASAAFTSDLDSFSVLDVGCGSGELLRYISGFARKNGKKAELVGLDLNEISTSVTAAGSRKFPEISAIRGDAFKLPFADGAFDYAISSLFFHHLTDDEIPHALNEMFRVARRSIYVIDLHRHPAAYRLYKLFCFAFRISPLVTQDGSLSILKGFSNEELLRFGRGTNSPKVVVQRSAPYRLVLTASCTANGSSQPPPS